MGGTGSPCPAPFSSMFKTLTAGVEAGSVWGCTMHTGMRMRSSAPRKRTCCPPKSDAAKLSTSALRSRLSRDGSYTVVIRSAVPKKPRGVKVKQKILKVLAKIAAREEEGLSEFIRRALEQYLKKTAKKRSRRGR